MAVDQDPAHIEETWPDEESGGGRFFHKLSALVYVFFCFELGVFLLLFPWLDLWQQNFFSGLSPMWYDFWNSPYVRGAVSGLGVIDLWISFSELFRLRRFSQASGNRSIE